MSFDVLDQETVDGLPLLSEVNDAFGVQINALSVDEIFSLYERTGFLYPEKAARLSPYIERVKENWRRMLLAGDSLLYMVTCGDEQHGHASITVWRSSHQGWMSQHLVSQHNPYASRAVILGASAARIRKGVADSTQNWFRPENRYPARLFGSMVQTIGGTLSSVQRHGYFALPRNLSLPSEPDVRVVAYDPSQRDALCAIGAAARSSVYVEAEELAEDAQFEAVDDLYRRVGLRRTRQIWLAYRSGKLALRGCNEEPIGAAIAYRGPLGMNFSYLENRCDLLLDPILPESEVPGVVTSLLNASSQAYQEFELDEIPVIADQIAIPALLNLGAKLLRHYCQGIWLWEGHPRFYRHVENFYSTLIIRAERRAMQERRSTEDRRFLEERRSQPLQPTMQDQLAAQERRSLQDRRSMEERRSLQERRSTQQPFSDIRSDDD